MVAMSPVEEVVVVVTRRLSVWEGERLAKSEVRAGLSFWGDGVVTKRTSTTGLCK